jgi:hypothetical protein
MAGVVTKQKDVAKAASDAKDAADAKAAAHKELKLIESKIQSELKDIPKDLLVVHIINQIEKYKTELYSVLHEIDRLKIERRLDIYKNYLEELLKYESDEPSDGLWQGYPDLNDPSFNFKIFNKAEFHRYIIKKQGLDMFGKEQTLEFIKNPTQNFIGTYLSPNTPYNSILLWLGVGVGKTCAALTAAENYRRDNGELSRSKITVLLPSENLIDSWRDQIFNIEKEITNPNKNINVQCTGDAFKNEIGTLGSDQAENRRKVNKVIHKYYEFMGYRKFANKVKNEIESELQQKTNREKRKIELIRKKYSNRIFILDEVHFTRQYANSKNKNKDIAEVMELIARYGENNKLILASATPMYNSSIEIVEILNMMLLNDKRAPIETSQVFKSDGYELTEKGEKILIEKSRGYISYLRGENPITFPIKIYPELKINRGDAVDSYIPNPDYTSRKSGEVLEKIETKDKIKDLTFIKCSMSEIQYETYKKVAHVEEDNDDDDEGEGDNFSIPSTVASNIVYPINKSTCMQGDDGFDNVFDTIQSNAENENEVKYKYKGHNTPDGEPFLAESNLNNYSSKFYNILQLVTRSEGICFFYSKYLKPGIISLALMLEQNGYSRFMEGNHQQLLHGRRSFQRCFCGLKDSEPHPKYDEHLPITNDNHPFTQGRYIFLTGKTQKNTLSRLINQSNGINNLYGQHIKFILGSNVLEQGINLFNVREVHILDPWHHLNRTEQVVGRAIRNFSHKNLPPNKRNVSVYLYCATIPIEYELSEDPRKKIETTDEKTYRHAYYKSKKIAIITRLFKKNAVDCLLNKNGNQLTVDYFGNTPMDIITSQKKTLRNQYYGDKDNDIICDFTNCEYDCYGQPDYPYTMVAKNKDTYVDILMSDDLSNGKKFIGRLYLLKNAYTIQEMLEYIDRFDVNIDDKYLYKALDLIVRNEESLYDNYHREGILIYKHPYYIFQPKELDVDSVSFYTRSIPLPIRKNKIVVSDISDTFTKIVKKDKPEDDSSTFIKAFRDFVDMTLPVKTVEPFTRAIDYIKNDTIYGKLAEDIYSEFLTILTRENQLQPEPHLGFHLLTLYFIFSVIDRLPYKYKQILISHVLINNIKNKGFKDLDDSLENVVFQMYEPSGSSRNSIFRLGRNDLPNVFRLYYTSINPDTHQRKTEASFFEYNEDSGEFEPVIAPKLTDYRRDYSYSYDELAIDYQKDMIYGYLQEKERRSQKQTTAEKEIGEFKNEVEFYLVDKRNHTSKTNRDGSTSQPKSEIKGAVCGTATYLNINKPELSDLIRYLLGTENSNLTAFLITKGKTNKHVDIYKNLKSGSLCELIELLLRHKQYVSPNEHFFFNYDEWEFMRYMRSQFDLSEKKRMESEKQPRIKKKSVTVDKGTKSSKKK